MTYFIPKNIKVKREIFKGFGLIELIVLGLSFLIGFLLQTLFTSYKIKVLSFVVFPIIVFLLFIPLPNGNNVFYIVKKYFIYKVNQKNYKYKN
ncbi:MAG: PrgI family protein [Bacilli bacterium]|nr:PrgI family protein [Bacilli bacterium]MBP3201720.1 PrgI family protein [Lachnospiraceae bacterium]